MMKECGNRIWMRFGRTLGKNGVVKRRGLGKGGMEKFLNVGA
jgi:hypothetical protein